MEISFNLKQLDEIIKNKIIPIMEQRNILIFKGPLGAGKTTMIKCILKKCGVDQIVSSPTFNYVNSYKSKDGREFHHFDLYRLDSLDSFLSLGFDEYFYKDNSFCFIEWPEIIETLFIGNNLQKRVCLIDLSFDNNDFEKRSLKLL